MKRIITIGREFGSGGREFGRRIAEKLQIAYFDQEIITARHKAKCKRHTKTTSFKRLSGVTTSRN